MPKVSVVMPVYNVEDYLAPCIDSIRRQTFDDIEIVCVVDGSRDRSEAILRLYAHLDERVKVVVKPNGGLSSARNAGIRVIGYKGSKIEQDTSGADWETASYAQLWQALTEHCII